jgi:TolA-binding protein
MAKKNIKEEAIGLDAELRKSEAFIQKNLKTILIALVGVIVIVAGVFIYQNHMDEVEAEAQTAISKSQSLFYQEQFETALNGDGAASKGFLKIISDYSGTKTANLANLYAGLCYYKMEKYDEAIEYLESFSPKNDNSVSPSAVAALGNCYIQKDQKEKGAEKLIEAANMAKNSLSPVFILQAAEVYENLGQNDKALNLYNEIKNEYPTSPIAQNIDKYIERVK